MLEERPLKNKLSNMLTKMLRPDTENPYIKNENNEFSFFPDFVDIHALVDTITLLLGLYDKYTAEHSLRVAALAEKISRQFDRSELEHRKVHIAAHLHDIGKIAITASLLNKKERLTDDEFDLIKKHPVHGADVINKVEPLSSISNIILHHHERFDGTGYPYGLKGKEIPFESRIIALADSFDAMITARPYKKAVTLSKAVNEILACSGSQFDPKIVDKFLDMILEIHSPAVQESIDCQIIDHLLS